MAEVPNGVSGSISPKDHDWERVRQAFRAVFSRLSHVEGRTGERSQLAPINMTGNAIEGGPANQETAQAGTFLTKSYLYSSEGKAVIKAAVPTATGASGTFTTADSKTVTVVNGIITRIV